MSLRPELFDDLSMSVEHALRDSHRSFIRARRLWMRTNKVGADEWYQLWPETAWAWERMAWRLGQQRDNRECQSRLLSQSSP